ncbi:MAG: hypothetical protein P1U84_12120 [Parvibaculaceae bacterium]|nr:hypothetical protein [Parvibaculaceae bacterium]
MLVGVSQAAKELGVSHSTISRYLRSYPELTIGVGRRKKVDLAELQRHRQENLSVDEGEGLPFADEAGPARTVVPREEKSVEARQRQSAARATTDELKAELLRIELAERRGELVPIEEIEAAFGDAGALLQARFESRRRDLAERLVTMTDVKEIEAFLKQADRDMLEAFSRRLGQMADEAEAELDDTDEVDSVPGLIEAA